MTCGSPNPLVRRKHRQALADMAHCYTCRCGYHATGRNADGRYAHHVYMGTCKYAQQTPMSKHERQLFRVLLSKCR